MKIGIIGAGAVGAACAMATIMRGCASELVLVNRGRERAKGMATDMGYGAPLSSTTRVTDGDYSDLAGAALVMITVGVNEKSGGATDRSDPAGRLRLLDKNAEVYRQVIPRINAAAPDAVLLVVTDPPDPLAWLTRELAGHDRVLSTGTLLDSLRFRVHLGRKLKVAPATIEAQVLGEHGTSQIFHWSGARVGGVPIIHYHVSLGRPAAERTWISGDQWHRLERPRQGQACRCLGRRWQELAASAAAGTRTEARADPLPAAMALGRPAHGHSKPRHR
jgi:L-lactate dehydrogenase